MKKDIHTRFRAETINEVVRQAIRTLRSGNVPDPEIDLKIIVSELLGISRSELWLRGENEFPEEIRSRLNEIIKRRLNREPLQYILGNWQFLDRKVMITPHVLIPRAETESMMIGLFEIIADTFGQTKFSFADIGTGSGIIGISILERFPASIGILSDIDSQSLECTRRNLMMLPDGYSRSMTICGDMLSILKNDSLELIVSNPPYIPRADIESLMPEVRNHEPRRALDGGENGCRLINILTGRAPEILRTGGIFALEHGFDQQDRIIAAASPSLSLVSRGHDMAGRERFLIWRKA